jgi:hypothetical protein
MHAQIVFRVPRDGLPPFFIVVRRVHLLRGRAVDVASWLPSYKQLARKGVLPSRHAELWAREFKTYALPLCPILWLKVKLRTEAWPMPRYLGTYGSKS